MVETRRQYSETNEKQRQKRNLRIAGVAIVLLAGLATVTLTSAFTGHKQQTAKDQAVGAWESIQQWAASSGQALPPATVWQRVQSVVQRKPLVQVQTEDLWSRTQRVAGEQLASARDTAASKAGDLTNAAAGKAGEVKDWAADKAGDALGYAKNRALPPATYWQSAKSWATGKPLEQVQAEDFYAHSKGKAGEAYQGAKDAAGGYVDAAGNYVAYGQRKAGEAYDAAKGKAGEVADQAQAKYNEATEETFWEKLTRLATGRSRSQAYLDSAKARAHNAGGHLSDAAHEAFEGSKAAAGSAWHSDAAHKATDKVKANAKAAGNVAGDTYEAAKGTASEYAAAGQQKAGEAYDATVGGAAENIKGAAGAAGQAAKDAYNGGAANTAKNAGSKAGLTMEKARHRAEEYAQELKHMAQEKMHAAQAEL